MGFIPISITDYIKIHLTRNPNDKKQVITDSLKNAIKDFKNGVKCGCGNDIWVIGSAFTGNSCFTCITGESFPSGDYEIDEAIHKSIQTADSEPIMGYYNDDGTKINPDLFLKPGLCLICINEDNPEEEILCNLTRMDQKNEEDFKCFAFRKR